MPGKVFSPSKEEIPDGRIKYIGIVGCRCRPEDEARFNKWYDEVHVPMLLKF